MAEPQRFLDCFLCSGVSSRGGSLIDSADVVLVADEAPLGDHHFLLAPKEHYGSFRSFFDSSWGARIPQGVFADIRRIWPGEYCFIEHGSLLGTGSKGCIEHAHIHVVSSSTTPFSVDRAVAKVSRVFDVTNVFPEDCFEPSGVLLSVQQEYVWISVPDGKGVMITGKSNGVRGISRLAISGGYHRAPATPELKSELQLASYVSGQRSAGNLLVDSHGQSRDPINVVLIEGLSGSGKSTVSKLLARRLGWTHVPSGLYFCAAALQIAEMEASGQDADAIEEVLTGSPIYVLDENSASEEIRFLTSQIFSRAPGYWRIIAKRLLTHVRIMANCYSGVVVDGRGLGEFWDLPVASFHLSSPNNLRKRRIIARRQNVPQNAFRKVRLQQDRDDLDLSRSAGAARAWGRSAPINTYGKTTAQVVAEIMALRGRVEWRA